MCSVKQDLLWADSMISELNPFTMPQSEFSTFVNGLPSPAASSQVCDDSPFDFADLATIPGRAAYPRVETPHAAVEQPPLNKRFKSVSNSQSSTSQVALWSS
ncbi:unnamed protein product [Cuscuta epithymum]|uniref:Uncharacterized protein n=1 Tax=Cuscuta epithymum TaxID=186058 RepID=A0AAV0G3S4_9ASTE|nr:unnamed protein product [Cuscuta epithymum]